jgi:hypothetical protein
MEEDRRVTPLLRIPALALAFMVVFSGTPFPGGPLPLCPLTD